MQLTRRGFLKLVAVASGGLALGLNPEGASTVDATERIGEFLSGQAPVGFQADCLSGTTLFAAGYFTPWDTLASIGDKDILESIKRDNGISHIPTEGFINKGTVLMVPEAAGLRSNQEMIVDGLYRRLDAKLVMNPSVEQDRQFLPKEFRALSAALSNFVMPFLNRSAPEPAVRGLVLLGRAPDGLAASYAEDPSHAAVSRLDYVPAGPNAFSYVRDGSGSMVSKKGPESNVFARRIYLLREPSEELKAKILSGSFLMAPEWGAYYFGTMSAMAHELMHSIVTRDYDFPPFDTHNVVRAKSFACVLDYLHSGKGKWKQGSLPEAVWSMPELEVLKVYPTFYKDLFAKLREGKWIGTIAFDEAEVVDVSDALFAAQKLGSFHERWDRWKGNHDTMTHGQSIDEKAFTLAMRRLGEENAAMAGIGNEML